MAAHERRYALDTNIYIRAFRDAEFNAALQVFHTSFAPWERLSAVVVQELRAGAKGTQMRELERHIVSPFERRGRVFTPTYAAWKEAGEVLAELIERKLTDWRNVSRAFVNDVLLAASCRETGIVLVTDNVGDFERIARVLRFSFATVPAILRGLPR